MIKELSQVSTLTITAWLDQLFEQQPEAAGVCADLIDEGTANLELRTEFIQGHGRERWPGPIQKRSE